MSVREVLLASRNRHKIAEIREMLADLPIVLVSPDDVGLAPEPAEDEVERWDTFEANALAKASWFRARTGLPTMSDDSGLCVEALGGAPGVRSRRFAPEHLVGPDGRDAANNRHLLDALADRPDPQRAAHYRCALALIEDRFQVVVYGRCDGRIATKVRGEGGFGYDPLFVPAGLDRTFGELGADVKAERSHRAAAVRAARPWLTEVVQGAGSGSSWEVTEG